MQLTFLNFSDPRTRQVRHLDFLDYGSIVLQPTIPRVKVWKRDMMKEYIKLDMDEDNFYGKLRVSVLHFFLSLFVLSEIYLICYIN